MYEKNGFASHAFWSKGYFVDFRDLPSPLVVVNLESWRKPQVSMASVGFLVLRWDGCRAWGIEKPSSCNDFWKLKILSVLGRYFACLEPRFRWSPFHSWPCIDLSVQLWKWLYLHGCEGNDTDAGSDLCGPVHVRSYRTRDLGPTKCSRICRSLRYGSIDICGKLRDGSHLVPIWHPCDPMHKPLVPGHLSWCGNVTSSNSSQCRWDHHG